MNAIVALATLTYCLIAVAIFWIFQWTWLFNAALLATALNVVWLAVLLWPRQRRSRFDKYFE